MPKITFSWQSPVGARFRFDTDYDRAAVLLEMRQRNTGQRRTLSSISSRRSVRTRARVPSVDPLILHRFAPAEWDAWLFVNR